MNKIGAIKHCIYDTKQLKNSLTFSGNNPLLRNLYGDISLDANLKVAGRFKRNRDIILIAFCKRSNVVAVYSRVSRNTKLDGKL